MDGKIIGLNPYHYGDAKVLKELLQGAVAGKVLPTGCDTIESVLTHEFGHHVMTWLLQPGQAFVPVQNDGFGLVRQAVSDFLQHASSRQRRSLGARAADSLNETWSAAFASLYHMPARSRVTIVRNLATLLKTLTSRRWVSSLDSSLAGISAQEVMDLYKLLEEIGAVPQ